MSKQSGFTIVELIFVVLIVGGLIGWIWNIVKLAQMCCEVSGMLILRVIGIFVAPLGAILGFIPL